MPFYSVDFHEGGSGFHAGLMLAQAWYLNECMKRVLEVEQAEFISRQFEGNADRARSSPHFPKRVIILAHSQGGMVSRLSPILSNHPGESIASLVLVNSPLQAQPFMADWRITEVYNIVNSVWAAAAGVIPSEMQNPHRRVSDSFLRTMAMLPSLWSWNGSAPANDMLLDS